MLDNIENINIIFSDEAGDLSIEGGLIKNIEEDILKENFLGVVQKLDLDFYVENNENNYEINSLLFHVNKVNFIVINFNNKPSVVYKKIVNRYESNQDCDFDYELKVLNTNNNILHLSLKFNTKLSKSILKFKESDVLIFSETNKSKPPHKTFSSRVEEYLIYRDNGKLRSEKINPRWLNAEYLKGARRIELFKNEKYEVLNDGDKVYLNNYFGEEHGDSTDYLTKIHNKIFKDIKKNTANRGGNIAIIHAYKYRVNEELGMFNILVEYLCGKRQ